MNTNQKISLIEALTQAHQKHFGKDKFETELAFLRLQFPALFLPLEKEDEVVGRMEILPVGFFPQEGALGFYSNDERWDIFLEKEKPNTEELQRIQHIRTYWKDKTTTWATRQAYPEALAEALPSDEWTTDAGIAFPLYRMAGAQLDFDKLLQYGLTGLENLVLDKYKTATPSQKKFYDALLSTFGIVKETASQLSEAVTAQALPKSKQIAEALSHISERKPQTLLEALQLVSLWAQMSGAFNFGRMDEYLGDFLVNDLENQRITEEEALSYIESFWKLIVFRKTIFDGRVIVGGKGRRNPENADRFAFLAIQASRNVRAVLPQLTLRFDKEQNPELYTKALEAIGEGCSFPLLYNDDVNIPSVAKAFEISLEEAENYLPFGCGEYIIYHKSFGTPNGVINLTKAVESCIFGGKDGKTGEKMGLSCPPLTAVASFEEFFENYHKQVSYYTEACALQQKIEYDVVAAQAGFLMYSTLFDDCIERGKPIFEGGIKYLGGTLETYGNTNASDSLLAIKKLVFDTKTLSAEALMTALQANYEGHTAIHKQVLAVPKYGNDDAEADEMLERVHNHICLLTKAQAEKVGLASYLVVNINNHANTILGRKTWASADGRKDGEFLANANNPQSGRDQNGITAVLNSLVKPATDIHAGAVQNMKFSKDMFNKYRPQTQALLATYFENGGAQAMISVLGKEDLEMALEKPQDYGHIIVRVGGFSAKFVELEPDVQQEILHRTLY